MSRMALKRRETEMKINLNFQARVGAWVRSCFGPDAEKDLRERSHRFLEEALELAQASGCTKEEALQLVEYTFSRPVGDPVDEVGGTITTLAALSNALNIQMDIAGDHALQRNWNNIEKIRAKWLRKPKFGPLPGAAPEEKDHD